MAKRSGPTHKRDNYRRVLSPEQRAYIEWLVIPKDVKIHEGLPSNERDYASANHMNRNTLTRWKQQMEFRLAWDERLQQLNVQPDRIQDVIDAMHANAMKGHMPSAKLYLEYVSQFMQQPAPPPKPVDPSELGDEELDALIAEAAEEEKARRAGA